MVTFTATYSPDDNKLRLYASSRLDKELYDRVRAAGFIYAPKQDLFVAPMWTPYREDLLIELSGEIDDEDTSLVERAEQRADRFEDYSDKRAGEAERTRQAVPAIADGIPFGQPILIGHHSEKRARKDAERIENGMRKSIKLWETSKYWQDRAAGALRHAKYKELPAVRHRRIKGIQADKRKQEREKVEAEKLLKLWISCEAITDLEAQKELALRIAGTYWLNLPRKAEDDQTFNGKPTAYDVLREEPSRLFAPRTVGEVIEHAKKAYPRTIAHCERWIAHYENRIAYETAMLNEQLGTESGEGGMSARFDIKVGGKVLVDRGEWLTVLRINKAGGVVNSITTTPPQAVTWSKTWKYGIEQVKDYQAPTEEQAAKVKKATALPPLCNYPGEGFLEMTEEQWKNRRQWSDFQYVGTLKETEKAGRHRVRQMPAPNWGKQQVFITDAKRVDPPKPASEPSPVLDKTEPLSLVDRPRYVAPERTAFDDMKDALKQGVKVVSANQLFPTPVEIAEQVIELADIQNGDMVLEPSAGTGALVNALPHHARITAIEISSELTTLLSKGNRADTIKCADFLEVEPNFFWDDHLDNRKLLFDRVVMNPPFENASDIKHVEHALKFLRPGGRLVSIVANGPRQQDKLKPLATQWIDLPPGSFKSSGTGVNTAIVVIDKTA